MRILIVSEDIPYPAMGGLAKHALTLARALVRAGHQVDLLGSDQHPIDVCGEEGQFGGRFFGELSGYHAGWKEVQLGTFMPLKRTWLARQFARTIMRRAANYDVVHYHGHVPNVALFIPKHVNFVQTRHDQGSDCFIHTRFRNGEVCRVTDAYHCATCINPHPNPVQSAVSAVAVVQYRKEVAASFRRHKTVFVSDMLQRNFSRTMGEEAWGTTVHNFVDLAAIQQARDAAPAAGGGERIEVFVAAKLYPPKGVEAFLRELAPRMPVGMRLSIAGEGPDEERLRAEFAREQIRFLGWCSPEQTLAYAAAATAIVVPSVWEEPCATTVFEGLLLGKATFALARGGTPELALYAASKDQLRLHWDMRSLVQDLVTFVPRNDYGVAANGLGGVDRAIEHLLKIYDSPARHSLNY